MSINYVVVADGEFFHVVIDGTDYAIGTIFSTRDAAQRVADRLNGKEQQ